MYLLLVLYLCSTFVNVFSSNSHSNASIALYMEKLNNCDKVLRQINAFKDELQWFLVSCGTIKSNECLSNTNNTSKRQTLGEEDQIRMLIEKVTDINVSDAFDLWEKLEKDFHTSADVAFFLTGLLCDTGF